MYIFKIFGWIILLFNISNGEIKDLSVGILKILVNTCIT